MQRNEVYKLIDGERDYQDALEKNPLRHDGHQHTTGDYLVLLNTYIARANSAWTDNGGNEPALDIIRKLAGICVHCMEDYGAPPRKQGG